MFPGNAEMYAFDLHLEKSLTHRLLQRTCSLQMNPYLYQCTIIVNMVQSITPAEMYNPTVPTSATVP